MHIVDGVRYYSKDIITVLCVRYVAVKVKYHAKIISLHVHVEVMRL